MGQQPDPTEQHPNGDCSVHLSQECLPALHASHLLTYVYVLQHCCVTHIWVFMLYMRCVLTMQWLQMPAMKVVKRAVSEITLPMLQMSQCPQRAVPLGHHQVQPLWDPKLPLGHRPAQHPLVVQLQQELLSRDTARLVPKAPTTDPRGSGQTQLQDP